MSAVLEESTGIDTDKMSTDLAADLGTMLDTSNRDQPANDAPDTLTRAPDGKFAKTDAEDPAAPVDFAGDQPAAPADPAATGELELPKSWKKEWADAWKATPRAAQEAFIERERQMAEGAKAVGTDAEYGRTLKSVIGRHEDVLRAQGLDAPKAVEYLFNAHRQLSTGTLEQRQAYLARVAQSYGLQMGAATPADPNAPAPAQLPPEVKAALERLDRIEGTLTQEQQQRYESHRTAIASEVSSFADAKDEKGNPKNPYFDECADHICTLLKGDPSMKLSVAYETAVWANPVTRQKELARIQQETDKANRERAQAAAKAAKKGTSTNVKGRDTARAPTAPAASLANLDDVMRETHEEIKHRAE